MFKIGFIGCGNMGGVLCRAAAKSVGGENILAFDPCEEKINELAREFSVNKSTTQEISTEAKYIFMGVKPQIFRKVLSDILPFLNQRKERFILVSMAAGVSISAIKEIAQENISVIRIMPNTPCAVGKGVVLISRDETVTDAEIKEFQALMGNAGLTDIIPEALIDAAGCVSGCGPAFVYMFIEALADGGVLCGLPRDKVIKYASQTVCGAAQMVLATNKNPEELKDAVCSPGGTTIEGVRALEKGGLRSNAQEAVIAAYEKTLKLKA